MKIILTNNTELSPLIVIGERKYVQRASRDTLTFIFPADVGLEILDEIFTPTNCETITIESDDGTYIYNGYTIRAELSKKSIQTQEPTEETEAVYEDRIFVSMSERTDMENQVAMMNEALNALATGEG